MNFHVDFVLQQHFPSNLVQGGFGDWIQADYCTQPCGIGGVIPFQRFCDNPKPKYRGAGCQGSSHRTVPCNEHIRCNKCKFLHRF